MYSTYRIKCKFIDLALNWDKIWIYIIEIVEEIEELGERDFLV